MSIYLFAIIFFWTPPHFWALSLLMKDEYARVGIPMLPVVRGERETRKQILLYSILTVGGHAAAVLRGGSATSTWCRRSCSAGCSSPARSRCTAAPTPHRLRLYLFSLAYLALLFGAMVVDAEALDSARTWIRSSHARTSAPASSPGSLLLHVRHDVRRRAIYVSMSPLDPPSPPRARRSTSRARACSRCCWRSASRCPWSGSRWAASSWSWPRPDGLGDHPLDRGPRRDINALPADH